MTDPRIASLPRGLALVASVALLLAACAGPVGTNRADPKVVLRELGRSATTTGAPGRCGSPPKRRTSRPALR